MGQVPPGTWKLFVYPLIGIIIFNLIFISVVAPFKNEGIEPEAAQNSLIDIPKNIIVGEPLFNLTVDLPFFGEFTHEVKTYPFFFSDSMKEGIASYFDTLKYIPLWILIPYILITVFLFVYGLVVIIIAIIP